MQSRTTRNALSMASQKSVNDRLSKRSSNEVKFNESKTDYELALSEAGYKPELVFQNENSKRKRKRKRKITWFNPPFCASVKTNIAREFIKLVAKHFTKRNPLRKLFNKSNVRVSYCCMNNIGSIIKAHNAKILKEEDQRHEKPCDCRKMECPFKGKGVSCNVKNIVYKAEVKTKKSTAFYIGLSEPEFKKRYLNHTSSFNTNRQLKSKPTALATYVRGLKERSEEFTIDWSVLGRTSAIRDGDAECRLCLKEATLIAYAGPGCINQRSEIANSCRHKKKFLLCTAHDPG